MADCLNLQPNNTQSCSPLMQRDFILEPGSSAYVYNVKLLQEDDTQESSDRDTIKQQ